MYLGFHKSGSGLVKILLACCCIVVFLMLEGGLEQFLSPSKDFNLVYSYAICLRSSVTASGSPTSNHLDINDIWNKVKLVIIEPCNLL